MGNSYKFQVTGFKALEICEAKLLFSILQLITLQHATCNLQHVTCNL